MEPADRGKISPRRVSGRDDNTKGSADWRSARYSVHALGRLCCTRSVGADATEPVRHRFAGGWLDIFAGLRERVLSIGGAPTLLPLSCPILTCYLRRDLLDKAGLKAPETWQEYQSLIDSLPKWAPGLTIAEPWSQDFRATTFLWRAVSRVKNGGSFSVFFDIDTGDPLIDSEGFVRALTEAVASVSKMSADAKTLTPAECRRLILTGKAAMALAFEPGRVDEPPVERMKGITLSFVRAPGSRQVYRRQSNTWETPAEQGLNYVTLAPFGGLAVGVSKGIPDGRRQAA